ncbi:glucosaminidase domain-containing protein [Rhodospirillales bacterium]|nr:glucosaminidase domain-containing protein [Rhodospirillales bacterium]
MTTRKFDRIILCFIGGAVLATATASIVSPNSGLTVAPRVSFDSARAEAIPLNQNARSSASGGIESASRYDIESLRKVQDLAQGFKEIGYNLDGVRDDALVPRVFLAELPHDLNETAEVSLKKTVFFKMMLPLILNENERILADRNRLHQIKTSMALGAKIEARDRLWLAVLAERYKLKDENIDVLLRRVDIVPPSLAMAQAAEESGWGTSRFARTANALYGQWTTSDGKGIIPEDRPEGMDHKVRAFDNLAQSVSAYMRNLNTHRAYREFRKHRKSIRGKGQALNGSVLAENLTRYSERGKKYVDSVRAIINVNQLLGLDDAQLVKDDADDQSV